MRQSDSRANRLEQMRRIAMDTLLTSTTSDGKEEVEIQDDDDDEVADPSTDMDMGDGYAQGKKMQRLRRLHRTLFFARQMQIPDWMLVPPQDLAESWLVLAKPEGDRCLLLSDGGHVHVRQKNGHILEKFTDSRFPRGLTILDAVCIEPPQTKKPAQNKMQDSNAGHEEIEEPSVPMEEPTSPIEEPASGDDAMGCAQGGKSSGKGRRRRPPGNRKYAICDVLVWGDMDMASTEAEFRLFWLQSRFEEMREKAPRRARPLQLIRALPATAESIRELYSEDFGYSKDSLMFLHREGRYQISEPVTPVAKLWRDRQLSRFVVDTPDEKGQDLPSKQSVVLEVRGGGRLRTADRHLVAQCREEDLDKLQGQARNKSLVRCDIEAIDVVNRCLQVVPVAHVPARSRVWPDSWARIVFQHLHRSGQSSYVSFEALMQAAGA